MKSEMFFKPTPLHREFLLLSILQQNANVTQRELADKLNVSISMVNHYLDEYEKKGLIQRIYSSTKVVEYNITPFGEARRKLLNIQYLESSLNVYNDAKNDCYKFFDSIIKKGFKNIFFYGAGEVAEIMLSVISSDELTNLNVLAIIDDDESKQGKQLIHKKIISLDDINSYDYDGIVISTYANTTNIYNKLIKRKIDRNKIFRFFE